jgi:hypothetical protein
MTRMPESLVLKLKFRYLLNQQGKFSGDHPVENVGDKVEVLVEMLCVRCENVPDNGVRNVQTKRTRTRHKGESPPLLRMVVK